MSSIAIHNATIVNEGQRFTGSVLIRNGLIEKISNGDTTDDAEIIINAQGSYLLPGAIDDQVHFREPGLTHKGDIYSESRAAIAGGVTSFMEMPNTIPQTTTIEELDKKYSIAREKSIANYSFYFGATNDNIEEITRVDPSRTCGLKVFMGSSTGNMLVDSKESLDRIFKHSPTLVATHCEDESTIRKNTELYLSRYGDGIPMHFHSEIRSAEACYLSSSFAVNLAKQHGTRLHLLHLSTGRELDLLEGDTPLAKKLITAEVCVHHLWFADTDYKKKGWRIKWNPAIKTNDDRLQLIQGLKDNRLDVVATDHAPHTRQEKENSYLKCPSGGPMVQHSLVAMLELSSKGAFPMELVVEKMCHAPAVLFGIDRRGFVKEGYHADLVLVSPNNAWKVSPESILYKCGWAPLEGETLQWKVTHTIVNGRIVYDNGTIDDSVKGTELRFNPKK